MRAASLTVILFGALVASGCAVAERNVRISDEEIISRIRLGETTKADVMKLLGNPTSVEMRKTREMWNYALFRGWVVPVIGAAKVNEYRSFTIEFMAEGMVSRIQNWVSSGQPARVTSDDSLLIQVPNLDILDVALQIGRSVGYSVSDFNRELRTVVLADEGYGFTLTISLGDDMRKLHIRAVRGEYPEAVDEESRRRGNRRLGDFRAQLLEKIE